MDERIEILTAGEGAKLARMQDEKFRELLDIGEIPAIRDGRNWKVPRRLLIEYIENRALSEAAERRGDATGNR